MDRFPPLRTLAQSALQRVDPFTGFTVGVGVMVYLQHRKIQQLDQRILAQDQRILAQDQRILAQDQTILNLHMRISKYRWILFRFWAQLQNSASDTVQLRANLLSTNVRFIRAEGKVGQLEKRIVSLENFKEVNKPYVWKYAFVVAAHILREYLGTYEVTKLLEAETDVYLNLLRTKFSANSTKAQKTITNGFVRIMDLRHYVAHPPAARLEMRALGPLIRTLESFQRDPDVPKDMGLVINILSSKLLPR